MVGPVGAEGSRREGRCVGIVVAMVGRRGVPARGGGSVYLRKNLLVLGSLGGWGQAALQGGGGQKGGFLGLCYFCFGVL